MKNRRPPTKSGASGRWTLPSRKRLGRRAVVRSSQALWLFPGVSRLGLQNYLLFQMLVGFGVIGLRLSALSLPFPHDPVTFMKVKFHESGRSSPARQLALGRPARNCSGRPAGIVEYKNPKGKTYFQVRMDLRERGGGLVFFPVCFS